MYFKSKFFSYTFRYRLRMFIIEKLTVHTSEDKKIKVSLSQFSTLPVMLKLVPCMTTTRGQHCSAPPRHRLNQISHIVSWYCSPFLLQHLAELIEGLRWRLSLAHTFIQLIPKVFNGIQVRRFGRPWKYIDVILLKVVHCYTRCVWPSVVLLEKIPLSVNYVHEVRLDNLVSVPYSC
jgi:hypothetical protein